MARPHAASSENKPRGVASPNPVDAGSASQGAPPTLFLAALEPSADHHAAELITAIRRCRPGARFLGLAGPRMRAAGCESLFDMTSRSAMLLGTVRIAGLALDLLRRIDRLFATGAVDAFVPVDSPTFNLPLARRAKARGLPVVYYIAPQVWAWAEFRINKIRRRTDRLAVILPFEEAYFRGHGINATFVGHPLIQSLPWRPVSQDLIADLQRLGSPVVACLPGSRQHVVEEVLPGQIAVCRRILARHPNAAFLFAAADEKRARHIEAALKAGCTRPGEFGEPPLSLRYRIEVGRNAELISAADLVLVASGTATLEVAFYRRPMVIMYNASKWGYQLVGRWLIRTKHLSLVNILAGRTLVPEFMPYYESTEPIAKEALDILANQSRREAMVAGLDALIRDLGSHQVADEAAAIVLQACTMRAEGSNAGRTGPLGSRHWIW